MVTCRKGKIGEEEKILEVANSAFVPLRNPGYNFKNSMPKVYNNNLNYSLEHHVVLKDDEIIATAGNLIRDFVVDNKSCKISFLGTVSTVPKFEKNGAMHLIMDNVEKEDKQQNVVFSVLTGYRKRYNYYGYEKAGQQLTYEFDDYFVKHYNSSELLYMEPFSFDCLNEYYNLYLKYAPLIFRTKENFKIYLSRKDNQIFGIYSNGTLIGYFDLSIGSSTVCEIVLDKKELLADVVKKIIIQFDLANLKVNVNAFDFEMQKEFDKISETKYINDYIHIRVYDMLTFLNMIISLNLKHRKFNDLTEVYKIDDKNYKIEIKNNLCNVELTNEKELKEFSSQQFVRFAFGTENLFLHISNLFPLIFDISEPDLF